MNVGIYVACLLCGGLVIFVVFAAWLLEMF